MDPLIKPLPGDPPTLRALRLRLSVIRWQAARIEERAALRRAVRRPPFGRKEFERFRRRDYNAVARAKAARAEAARVIEQIHALEGEQAKRAAALAAELGL